MIREPNKTTGLVSLGSLDSKQLKSVKMTQFGAQGAHTSSVSVYGPNIRKCMGEY